MQSTHHRLHLIACISFATHVLSDNKWQRSLTHQLSAYQRNQNYIGYYHSGMNNKPWSRSVREVDLACAPLLTLWGGCAAEADRSLPLVDGLICCRSKSTTPESLLSRWSIDSCLRSSLAILKASISCIYKITYNINPTLHFSYG